MKKSFQNIISLISNPKTILGVLLSFAGIYWAFRGYDFNDLINSIRHSRFIFIILAMALLLLSVWIRAIRWEFFFRHEKKLPLYSLFKAEMIGYFGNSVLPLRLGELLRVYIVKQEHQVTGSFVLGTVVLERLLDTVGLLTFSLLMLFIAPIPADIKWFIQIATIVIIVLAAVLVFVVLKVHRIKTDNYIVEKIKIFFSGFHVLGGKLSGYTLFITLLLWAIYWFDVHLINLALGLNLSMSGSLLVLIISSLAYSIPSAPGTIGTYHAAVKYVLITMIGGYSPDQGVTFGIILHAYGYILFTVLGGWYFMKSQFHHGAISSIMEKKPEAE
ncbi:MAG: flippase-like domain-containing protein [Candidatus Marinimicrobia bacterium]|nr:flippase-like domain-containing protein [Candidatus Neomarinimicrobiota bacterium]